MRLHPHAAMPAAGVGLRAEGLGDSGFLAGTKHLAAAGSVREGTE